MEIMNCMYMLIIILVNNLHISVCSILLTSTFQNLLSCRSKYHSSDLTPHYGEHRSSPKATFVDILVPFSTYSLSL